MTLRHSLYSEDKGGNGYDDILLSLGTRYAAGGEFTENIDRAGGKGTAEFADRAIRAYCRKKQEG